MCIQEVLWMKSLLLGMGNMIQDPVSIYVDSQSAIAMANNDGYQSRAKHIDIRYHFIREHIKSGDIKLNYLPAKKQLADFLTKAIATKQFHRLVQLSHIGICKSRGSVEDKIPHLMWYT